MENAYGRFKEEAQNVNPNYAPSSANIDGWNATKGAIKKLFPSTIIILCYLHGFLKIRDRCKHMKSQINEISKRVWEAYQAPNKVTFRNRITALKKWTQKSITPGAGFDAIVKLCDNAGKYTIAYDHPSSYRTSNMFDRIMDRQDKYIYNSKYFHGNRQSSEHSVRAWSLLFNFLPYSARSEKSKKYQSPAHKLNGFTYSDNWLKNLNVCTSMGGWRT